MTREEAIKYLIKPIATSTEIGEEKQKEFEAYNMAIEALQRQTDGEDLIIKGAKGIQDGLYNIKGGKLFQYKAKGGTVRTYKISSADAVQGEWIMHGEPPWLVRECSECGTKWHQWSGDSNPNYCGNCGARMKGGGE